MDKSESRSSISSSILKPRKPRQALQNVDFDSSFDENSPTTVSPKLKRRVSFAEKKHVKQFCHLTDQGTVWDNTYEEHDISHKGFNDTEEGCMILNEKPQSGKIKNFNISDASHVSGSTLSNNIVYRNSDGKKNYTSDIGEQYYTEPCFNINSELDKTSTELDKTCIKNISMEFTTAIPTSLTVSSIKDYVVKNSDSIKNISMELTTAIPTSLAVSPIKDYVVKNSDISLSNSSTNCYNCNVSMEVTEALPVSVESTNCNLGVFEQISATVPNYENAKHDVTSNIHDNTIFSINTESGIASKSMIFDQKQDANYANDVMALIQSTSTDACTNDIAFNTSMEMTAVASKIYKNDISHPCNKNVEKCSTVDNIHDNTIFSINTESNIVSKQKQDVNYTNDSMVLTTIVQPTNTVTCHNSTFNTSMEITAAVTPKIYAGDIQHCYNKSIVERNDLRNINTDETKFSNDILIEMTRPVNIISFPHNKENLRMVESRSGNDRTALFLNTSMEMTKMVLSRNREVANLVAHESKISDKNTQAEKDKSTEFIKDTTNSQLNLEDSISNISECNFLTKNLSYSENSFVELESIKPPLFVCLDSEEENSFQTLHQNKLQTLSIADNTLINNRYNNCDQSTINSITESVCSVKRSTVKNCENVATIKKKEEPINNRNNQTEDSCENTVTNKVKEHQKESECIIVDNALVNDKYDSSNKLTNSTKSECTVQSKKNLAKFSKKYLNVEKSMEVEQYAVEKTEVLIKDTEKYYKENSNVELQTTEQQEECIEKRPEAEQSIDLIEDEFVINQNWFLSLLQGLKIHGHSDNCIWNVYHENIDRRIITFGFIANSLLIAMYLSDINHTEKILKIQKITIISRITDDSGVLIKIVHKLILEKLNAEILIDFCKTREDILPMLDFVSQDVTLVMNFMLDLKRLSSLNLMEISTDEITFISPSKHMDIILKVTIKVKWFDKLTSNDIDVHCLLGTVRGKEVRNLIKNVKKDYKFLTRYMNDVKNYLNIMEESFK